MVRMYLGWVRWRCCIISCGMLNVQNGRLLAEAMRLAYNHFSCVVSLCHTTNVRRELGESSRSPFLFQRRKLKLISGLVVSFFSYIF